MKRMMLRAICLAGLGLGTLQAREPVKSPAMERFDAYLHEMETGDADSGSVGFAENIAQAYGTLLQETPEWSDALVEEDEDGLRALFRASYIAAFYTGDPRFLEGMERSLSELEKRREASAGLYTQMYETYVKTSRWEEAKALALRTGIKNVRPIPTVRPASSLDLGKPALFRLDADGKSLRLENKTLNPAYQVVVTVGAYCKPSHRALADIRQDGELSELLSQRAIWLLPADGAIHMTVLKQWETEYPAFDFGIAYGKKNWPMIETWATPVFYVFKHGELVDKVVGWPEGGKAKELRKSLSLTEDTTTP